MGIGTKDVIGHKIKELIMSLTKMKSELKLTDEQNTKLTDLASEVKAVLRESRFYEIKSDVKQLNEAESLEASQVKAIIQTKKDESNKRLDANIDRIFPKLKVFHDSLAPEQRKKLTNVMRNIRAAGIIIHGLLHS